MDPIVLIKMTFIQYMFGIRSMRKRIEEMENNLAYRWFLGFGFHDKVPHFSTFGKNYERRFKDTDLFEQISYHILKQAADYLNRLAWIKEGFIPSCVELLMEVKGQYSEKDRWMNKKNENYGIKKSK